MAIIGASTDPAAADLSARLHATRLIGDPSSPHPHPPLEPATMRLPAHQYYHPQPQPSSLQSQSLVQPITAADILRYLGLQAAPAQQYHHPPTQPQSYSMGERSTDAGHNYGYVDMGEISTGTGQNYGYGMGESSTGAGQNYGYGMGESSTGAGYVYVPPYASISTYASHFGKNGRRPNPIAPPNPSVPPPRSSSTLSPSANQFQPAMHPNLAAYRDDHDPVFNPYASAAFQSTLFADPADDRSWVPAAAPRWSPAPAPTLAQVRSRMFRRPMDPELFASPVTSPHVARLLEDGDEDVRRSVLATFKSDARCFMKSSAERQAVLLALFRACLWRPHELQDIVYAVYDTNGFLSGVVRHDDGLTALELLITAVVAHPRLLLLIPLIDWLLREPTFYKCSELLEHCLITMPYDHSKILIRFAIVNIAELLSSSSGPTSLAHCFMYARNKELEDLEKIILDRTTVLATDQYGNYLLQRVIKRGGDRLQVAIAERVAADVVSLSLDQFGSFVVESCFINARSLAPLRLVVNAFLALDADDLSGLVRGVFSNYVVSKLLLVAKEFMPAQARELAQRIGRLPAAVQCDVHARGVMAAVRKLIDMP